MRIGNEEDNVKKIKQPSEQDRQNKTNVSEAPASSFIQKPFKNTITYPTVKSADLIKWLEIQSGQKSEDNPGENQAPQVENFSTLYDPTINTRLQNLEITSSISVPLKKMVEGSPDKTSDNTDVYVYVDQAHRAQIEFKLDANHLLQGRISDLHIKLRIDGFAWFNADLEINSLKIGSNEQGEITVSEISYSTTSDTGITASWAKPEILNAIQDEIRKLIPLNLIQLTLGKNSPSMHPQAFERSKSYSCVSARRDEFPEFRERGSNYLQPNALHSFLQAQNPHAVAAVSLQREAPSFSIPAYPDEISDFLKDSQLEFTFLLDFGEKSVSANIPMIQARGCSGRIKLKADPQTFGNCRSLSAVQETQLNVEKLRIWPNPNQQSDNDDLKMEITGLDLSFHHSIEFAVTDQKTMLPQNVTCKNFIMNAERVILRDLGLQPQTQTRLQLEGVNLTAQEFVSQNGQCALQQVECSVNRVVINYFRDGVSLDAVLNDFSFQQPCLTVQADMKNMFDQNIQELLHEGLSLERLDFRLGDGRYHFNLDGNDLFVEVRGDGIEGSIAQAGLESELNLAASGVNNLVIQQKSKDGQAFTFQGLIAALQTELNLKIDPSGKVILRDIQGLRCESLSGVSTRLGEGPDVQVAAINGFTLAMHDQEVLIAYKDIQALKTEGLCVDLDEGSIQLTEQAGMSIHTQLSDFQFENAAFSIPAGARLNGQFTLSGESLVFEDLFIQSPEIHYESDISLHLLDSQIRVCGSMNTQTQQVMLSPESKINAKSLVLEKPSSLAGISLQQAEVSVCENSMINLSKPDLSEVSLAAKLQPSESNRIQFDNGTEVEVMSVDEPFQIDLQVQDGVTRLNCDLQKSFIHIRDIDDAGVNLAIRKDGHITYTGDENDTFIFRGRDVGLVTSPTDAQSMNVNFQGPVLEFTGNFNTTGQDISVLSVDQFKMDGDLIVPPLVLSQAKIDYRGITSPALGFALSPEFQLQTLPERALLEAEFQRASCPIDDKTRIYGREDKIQIEKEGPTISVRDLNPKAQTRTTSTVIADLTSKCCEIAEAGSLMIAREGSANDLNFVASNLQSATFLIDQTQEDHDFHLRRIDLTLGQTAVGRLFGDSRDGSLRAYLPGQTRFSWDETGGGSLFDVDYDERGGKIQFWNLGEEYERTGSLSDFHIHSTSLNSFDYISPSLTFQSDYHPANETGVKTISKLSDIRGHLSLGHDGGFSGETTAALAVNNRETGTRIAGAAELELGRAIFSVTQNPNSPLIDFTYYNSPTTVALSKIVDNQNVPMLSFHLGGILLHGNYDPKTGYARIGSGINLLQAFGVKPTNEELARRAHDSNPQRKLYDFSPGEWMYDALQDSQIDEVMKSALHKNPALRSRVEDAVGKYPVFSRLPADEKIAILNEWTSREPQMLLKDFFPKARLLNINYDSDLVIDTTSKKPTAGSKVKVEAYFLVIPEKSIELNETEVEFPENPVIRVVYESELTDDLNHPVSGKIEFHVGSLKPASNRSSERNVIVDFSGNQLKIGNGGNVASVPIIGWVVSALVPTKEENLFTGLFAGFNTYVSGLGTEFEPGRRPRTWINGDRGFSLLNMDLQSSDVGDVRTRYAGAQMLLENMFHLVYTWNGAGPDIFEKDLLNDDIYYVDMPHGQSKVFHVGFQYRNRREAERAADRFLTTYSSGNHVRKTEVKDGFLLLDTNDRVISTFYYSQIWPNAMQALLAAQNWKRENREPGDIWLSRKGDLYANGHGESQGRIGPWGHMIWPDMGDTTPSCFFVARAQ